MKDYFDFRGELLSFTGFLWVEASFIEFYRVFNQVH